MRKEPERRYASVEHFAEDIRCYLQNAPISARPETFDHQATKFLKRNKSAVTLTVVIVIAFLCGFGLSINSFYRQQTTQSNDLPGKNETPRINSIAILPLKSLVKNENENALALGLTDALITGLGSLQQIAVRLTSAVLKFTDSEQDAAEIGQKLNVDVILAGTIQENNHRLRLNLHPVSVATGEQIWAQNFDQPTGDIFSLQDAVSTRISQSLVFELQQTELATITKRPTRNTEAYEKYLRSRFYAAQNNEQGFAKAIELDEQAIALDPNFAEAHAGLADVYVLLYNFGYLPPNETIPKARQSINRALEINSKVYKVYPTLALIQFFYDLDYPAAEKSLHKAIEINPNQAYVYLRHGYFLTLVGKFDEALAELEKARELDPLSPLIQTNIAAVYYSQKRYPETIERLEKNSY